MALTARAILLTFLMLVTASAGMPLPSAAADEAPKRTLSLAATGTVKAAPDQVDISTGVTSDAPTAREALDKNNDAMARVVAALKDDGIEPKDIQTTDFSVEPLHDERKEAQTSQRIIGYRVSNTVRVSVHDSGKLGQVLDKVVKLGANEIGAIEFSLSEPEALKDEARKLAMANAIANAKLYADAAGVELGPVLTISEDEGSYQARYSVPAARQMSESVPIEAGTTSVEVKLSVSWELK